MNEQENRNLTGKPSDYGSRTLESEERERMERGEIGRTADGDELVERGTADSAMSRIDQTNADTERLADT